MKRLLALLVAFLAGGAAGALAYRAELRHAWLASFGVASGHDRAYAQAVAARAAAPCAQAGPVLLILGQSNAAATVPGLLDRPRAGVVNFNALDGRCTRAEEPLLGLRRPGQPWQPGYGTIWSLVADGLLAQGAAAVTLAPIAQPGASVQDWSRGPARERLLLALHGLRRAGLAPTAVLWHQGETDAARGTPPEAYRAEFEAVLATLRNHGVDAPVYVARATICRSFPNEAIRAAQAALAELPGVFAGPDTDALAHVALRHDGCHFSAEGGRRAARLWLESLVRQGG